MARIRSHIIHTRSLTMVKMKYFTRNYMYERGQRVIIKNQRMSNIPCLFTCPASIHPSRAVRPDVGAGNNVHQFVTPDGGPRGGNHRSCLAASGCHSRH